MNRPDRPEDLAYGALAALLAVPLAWGLLQLVFALVRAGLAAL